MGKADKYELIAELARRRGFFWPSFEIYGGVSGFIDLGPLGAIMKRKIEDKWIQTFVRTHGLLFVSSPVITPAKVFEASGHLESFKDPMVECSKCKRRYRADHLVRDSLPEAENRLEALSPAELDNFISQKNIRCPECGGEFSRTESVLTMFRVTIGPYSDAVGFGRPEAAQGMFTSFKRLYEFARERLPLGIAQIGTALRNEISPRQGPIRLREFTIMEFEFFFDPEDASCPMLRERLSEELPFVTASERIRGAQEPVRITVKEALDRKYIQTEWLAYFMTVSKKFVEELGIPFARQRFHEKLPGERAHYSSQTFDHEVLLDRWGWVEVAGHSYRTDFDLKSHMKYAGVDLTAFKRYPEPKSRTTIKAVPIQAKIGPTYRENASKITKIISDLNESAIRRLQSTGELDVEGFRILRDYVEIKEETVQETGQRFVPHVVEPSYGVERLLYATLEYAHTEFQDRVVLKIPKQLAPIQAEVFPLVAKDGIPEYAYAVYTRLASAELTCEYEDSGTIGRRYARADEIGVPLCLTVDYRSLKDNTITLRDRDTWSQVRTRESDLPRLLADYFKNRLTFAQLGEPVANVGAK